jgi:hypothetical protein
MADASGRPQRCPLDGGALDPWLTLPDPATRPTVGMPTGVNPDDAEASVAARLLDRCQGCGAGVPRHETIDLAAELSALERRRDDGRLELASPNRGGLAATLGGEAWACLDDAPGRLLLTPRSLELLAVRSGRAIERVRFPKLGRNQGWMWQTLINGLTLHPNFAREVRAGRLRAANSRGPISFAIDCVVTVLAAPLVALVSFPLELAAALARRGGEIVAPVAGGSDHQDPPPGDLGEMV